MSHDGFWRTRDDDGLVHHTLTISHPVLLNDNNVDYDDETTTFCERNAGDWPEAPRGTPTTCLACFAAWLKRESTTITYVNFHEKSRRVG